MCSGRPRCAVLYPCNIYSAFVTDTDSSELDQRVRALCAAADYQAATTLILKTLGADVVRVIHGRFRDETSTAEVFSSFAEDLWMAIASFSFRCSVRAWVFTIARNAGSRYLKRDVQRQRQAQPLSQVPELAEQAAVLRSTTLAHLRTTHHDRVHALRNALSEDEQLLLTLRLDRRLEWREIAVVMLGEVDASPQQVTAESARLRKRFQLLKEKLKRLLTHTEER